MLLKSELKNFWLSSGIRKGDNILLHSNIKRTYFIFKKKHKNFKIDDYDSTYYIVAMSDVD